MVAKIFGITKKSKKGGKHHNHYSMSVIHAEMKERFKELKGRFSKLFQKDHERESLALERRRMFEKLYQPSTNEHLSESLKCRLLPSSNFESDESNLCNSPISIDFHTSPQNKAFFEPHTNESSLEQDVNNCTMDQLCSILDKEIIEMQNLKPKNIPHPQRYLSNSSLATITEVQNVKFNHSWGTLYNVNQYPSDLKQWSFYKTRAEMTDTKPPRLVKVIRGKQ